MQNLIGGGSSALALLQRIEELDKRNKIQIADGITAVYNSHVAQIVFDCGLKQYSSGWNNVTKLPEELYPASTFYFNVLRKSTSGDVFEMSIRSTGEINLWLPSGTTNVDFRGSVTYILA